jgi:hypothetical protein
MTLTLTAWFSSTMGHVYNRLIPYGSGGSKILQNEVGNPDQNDVTIAAACNFF